ncbi:MAG: ABC transporter ATP-binding protein [Puniceicoccales bacterium]|jgi:ABC-type dipeptide/oligopeptide/nickel transport system ATPase component|nr:ABC transporter ATP-binding protein [Puniceicoccales bacterium]
MPLLILQNVTIAFPMANGVLRQVVRGVDLRLDRGRTLSLIGASGSGKTITALAIGRLLPKIVQLGGSILFSGIDVVRSNDGTLRRLRGARIAYIFQEPMACLNPRLTAGQQVEECLRLCRPKFSRREVRATILRWFERLHLPDPLRVYHSYPHMLSGGMAQRVMVAMALCNGPELLIADEPTSALDCNAQRLLLELLLELRSQLAFSLLFIGHDLHLAQQLGHDVAVMDDGCMVEVGPVRQVFGAPKHPKTIQLLTSGFFP